MAKKQNGTVGGLGSSEDLDEMEQAAAEAETGEDNEATEADGFALADNPDEAIFDWAPKGGLIAPDPRPGFEQKWVRRIAPNGVNDATHLSYQMGRAGWKPRSIKTVPEGERALFPMTSDRAFGEVITSGDLMLCERPKRLGDARRAFYRDRTNRQIDLVNQEIATVNQQAGRSQSRMGVAEDRTRVTLRRPIVQSD